MSLPVISIGQMREWEQAALAETWREPDHEAEALQVGVVTADYRVPAAAL